MTKKMLLLIIIIMLLAFLVTGCLPGDGAKTIDTPANFLTAIWHGWVAPISLIVGVFNNNIKVYEVYNTGWWYDFGFYIAVISGFGGLSLSRRKKRNHDDYSTK